MIWQITEGMKEVQGKVEMELIKIFYNVNKHTP